MSASSQLIATAIAQWRNAVISCMINKNDPFNAITCIMNMIAMLPENERPKLEEMKIKEPVMEEDWADDPEEAKYNSGAWQYFRELSYLIEEHIAMYVANAQTRRQFT